MALVGGATGASGRPSISLFEGRYQGRVPWELADRLVVTGLEAAGGDPPRVGLETRPGTAVDIPSGEDGAVCGRG
jgi:hypothetical protein